MHEIYAVYQDYHKDLYRISEFKKISLFICQNGNWTCCFVYQLVNKVNKLLKHCLHLQTTDGKKSRSSDHALCQFMIMGIGFEGEVKNDKSTTICVHVRDAIVDDKRSKKQASGVKR